MGEVKMPHIAEKLLRYFEHTQRNYPDQHWQNGVDMCHCWLALYNSPEVLQSDIDAFLSLVESESNPGTGWIELDVMFRQWARSVGHAA
jgi:hypothetical protein